MIIHIISSIPGLGNVGGTEKHYKDLGKAFPQYRHILSTWPTLIDDINRLNLPVELLHIHAIFGMDQNIIEPIFKFLQEKQYKTYITVHDYQWLYFSTPNPSSELLRKNKDTCVMKMENMWVTQSIFSFAERILFPSEMLLKQYIEIMNQYHNDIQIDVDAFCKSAVFVPHVDCPIHIDRHVISKVAYDNTVNIGFIGSYVPPKGTGIFNWMANNITTHANVNLAYHIFGIYLGTSKPDYIHSINSYSDDNLISKLRERNIHIICQLSIPEETYCYALSRSINTGLPIIYMNRGAIKERLAKGQKRFFPITNPTDKEVTLAVYNAVEYVLNNQANHDIQTIKKDDDKISTEQHTFICPAWYQLNYPHHVSTGLSTIT